MKKIVLLAALLSLSPTVFADATSDVRCREIAFSEAAENKDADAFRLILDGDARFVGNVVSRGPDEIVVAWEPLFAVDGPSIRWRPQFVEVREDGDLAAFVARGPLLGAQQLVGARGTALGAVRPTVNERFDLRGVAFGPGGQRLYAVSRFPAALVALDLRERDGVIQVEPAWVAEACSEPSLVVLGPHDRDPAAQFARPLRQSPGRRQSVGRW